ncbi:hypothetical protein FEM48_Zijuj10G0124700 [Ziziphus jujuba var. spinosa]|uniref:O-fucosyltransferase family protein n=1 Tax=Ziziphus jujuba var. spinosa TaxID=714518 RepID=A0A978UND9_ZIZJJ|nr:hypothetical protein FEM48_Zijuj10G0124700 [Ziziphus jujuba var. spinosa]
MHPYNRLPSSGHSTPSPPPSPLRSPRLRHGRSKAGRFNPPGRTLLQRLTWHILSVLIRRQGVFLFAPLLYISGMLLYMGSVSFDVVPVINHRPAPGSVYRRKKLKKGMNFEESSSLYNHSSCPDACSEGSLCHLLINICSNVFHLVCKSELLMGFHELNHRLLFRFHYELDYTAFAFYLVVCIGAEASSGTIHVAAWHFAAFVESGHYNFLCLPDSNGYIYVEANGGLNQQRTSFQWRAILMRPLLFPTFIFIASGEILVSLCSKFDDIYDEDYFVSTLENDVRVVNKIPEYLMERFDHNLTNVYNFRVKAWSPIQYYGEAVLPKLLEEKVIRISPFANRLSFDAPPAVQRLRCLANYEALKFSSPILTLGETLVARMKERSAKYGGKYVSVHLRFEEDMVAFSCCIFDGGKKEKEDMDAARERGWKGKFTKPGRVIRPGAIRINGKCPLTPLEVGLILRGMGFDKSTFIYLASGKIYNAEKNMAPLLEMFPNLQTKEMLASEEELAPYKNYSSRMAAIDYTVCLHSEVFVTTQGGNFPHFLMGHRRYLYGGHSKTIRPDKRKLVLLFDNPNIGWRSFKRQLLNMRSHSDSKGHEIKRRNDSIYTFPCPDCMCRVNKTEDTKSSSAP